MAQFKEVYKCSICGNIVEVLHAGGGTLVCCGQPMDSMAAKTQDQGAEKHVPVAVDLPPSACQVKDGIKIKVGEAEHPMVAEHFIEWIEINTVDGKSGKKFLKPGEKPESDFYTRMDIASVRAYCNVHGLWELKK
ncbi:MAG TPA: desulfoferrodoxin [Candidatus Paceibacterota bacterium]|nr:desulfoferrodoxin [Candidatus Pacearchaeota archaeon]HRZ50357.1 desulfoferrodoxin [Candidatus Paceibacterota bacterium]HSA36078.1 desulfoferrodoxin [Candidatus Paceibacterota bacterium]